jgi:pimeloyl-ACP methyl ester carboxylesterase
MATEHPSAVEPVDEWTEMDGLQLHYLSAGSGGTPTLLLHGGIVDAATLSWGATIGPLAKDGRVVALDMAGYGNSARPDVSYSTAFHVDVVSAVVDELGFDSVNLVGVSMGGGVGLGYALRAPDRVENLVLVDSYGLGRELPNGLLTYALSRVPQLNRLSLGALRRNRRLARESLRSIVYDVDTLSQSVIDEYYRLLQHPQVGKAYWRWRRHEVRRSEFRTDYSSRLDDVTASTLLVHGEEDPIFPFEWSRSAADAIPDSRLEALPQCGHWPPRERTDTFNRIVTEFLTE